jgi:hypothetical protein
MRARVIKLIRKCIEGYGKHDHLLVAVLFLVLALLVSLVGFELLDGVIPWELLD